MSGRIPDGRWEDAQEMICRAHGAAYVSLDMTSKVGVARDLSEGRLPINGLRHPPDAGTSGWFLWSGIELPQDEDFFVPLHAHHLEDWCPIVIKFLGLPPGWRFLLAGDHEDVWYDPSLLSVG